jgi:hypothetical protein
MRTDVPTGAAALAAETAVMSAHYERFRPADPSAHPAIPSAFLDPGPAPLESDVKNTGHFPAL